MKKIAKKILCFGLIMALCLCFTGCKELDRMRARHATLQEDGTLILNGKTYVPLPYCEELTPVMGWGGIVRVTAPDVPLLLSDYIYDNVYYASEDGRFVGEHGTYFCLEEEAAAITARIEGGYDLSKIGYFYSAMDKNTGYWLDTSYSLTEEQKNTVRRVLATVTPRTVDGIDSPYCVVLNEQSDDGLFSRYLCDLYLDGLQYRLVYWDDSGIEMCYDVPEEYSAIFKEIMTPYMEANDGWW